MSSGKIVADLIGAASGGRRLARPQAAAAVRAAAERDVAALAGD
jgi:hypothetical protein